MDSESEHVSDLGVSISLDIPAKEPRLFKHSATNDVLRFLASHYLDEYTIRELADRTEYGKTSISQVVDVLEGNGLVDVAYDGPAKLVSINTDRLDVPENPILRIPQSEYHEPVRAAVTELIDELDDLVGIVLYGSVARGEADRQSDIDLWVLVSDNRMRAQRTVNEIVQDLEDQRFNDPGERYGFHVDVEQTGALSQYTKDIYRIINSGIALYVTSAFEKAENIIDDMVENSENE